MSNSFCDPDNHTDLIGKDIAFIVLAYLTLGLQGAVVLTSQVDALNAFSRIYICLFPQGPFSFYS